MRFIIYGAGGVGGTIGARLHQHGHRVLLIARGPHQTAISEHGLSLRTPEETLVQKIEVVASPAEIDFRPDDVVLLTMKSQHSWDALLDLRAAAGSSIPVICAQNGVDNERMALRLFQQVYGMFVFLPANHFEAGIVECNAVGRTGILDLGRYPSGTDELMAEVAKVLQNSDFSARTEENIMRWKYLKLLINLDNSLQALCNMREEKEASAEISTRMRDEALAVYRAAGIEWASDDEQKQRLGDHIQLRPIDGQRRAGGSSWQSLKNAKGDIESDFLNGEIVALGRLHGVATPANQILQQLAAEAARQGKAPGGMKAAQINQMIADMDK